VHNGSREQGGGERERERETTGAASGKGSGLGRRGPCKLVRFNNYTGCNDKNPEAEIVGLNAVSGPYRMVVQRLNDVRGAGFSSLARCCWARRLRTCGCSGQPCSNHGRPMQEHLLLWDWQFSAVSRHGRSWMNSASVEEETKRTVMWAVSHWIIFICSCYFLWSVA
jgi:hypothetical protein